MAFPHVCSKQGFKTFFCKYNTEKRGGSEGLNGQFFKTGLHRDMSGVPGAEEQMRMWAHWLTLPPHSRGVGPAEGYKGSRMQLCTEGLATRCHPWLRMSAPGPHSEALPAEPSMQLAG